MIVLLKYQAPIILGPDPEGKLCSLIFRTMKRAKKRPQRILCWIVEFCLRLHFCYQFRSAMLTSCKVHLLGTMEMSMLLSYCKWDIIIETYASSLLTLATSGIIHGPPSPTAVKLPNYYILQVCSETDDCIGYNYNKIERSCEIVLYVTNKMPTSVNESGWELWLKSKPTSWYICTL